jgi:hypothetical protein
VEVNGEVVTNLLNAGGDWVALDWDNLLGDGAEQLFPRKWNHEFVDMPGPGLGGSGLPVVGFCPSLYRFMRAGLISFRCRRARRYHQSQRADFSPRRN